MRQRQALLLVNRNSRQGSADLESGLDCLRNAGIVVQQEHPTRPEDVDALIRRWSDRIELVIVGGGDGTMNAAADALVDCGLPLGILPMGTANDLARTLQIPLDLQQACRIIADGQRRAIDLGRVNGKGFFNVASIGLAAQVTESLSREIKRQWGVLGYAVALFKAKRRMRPFTARIHWDGQDIEVRSVQISVGNGRHYGGGMTIAPDAAIDDHQLDLYSLAPQSLMRMLMLLPKLRSGPQGNWTGIHVLCGREIVLETSRPMPVSTDGELTTSTPATFHVAAGAIQVFVPAEG